MLILTLKLQQQHAVERTPRPSHTETAQCRYRLHFPALRRNSFSQIHYYFYMRRNARVASAVLAIAFPSVCLSVCPSVTRRYCVKTTARSTVQFALFDSKMCLVL